MKRRRQRYWVPAGVIACAEAVFALALSRVLPLGLALALAAALYFVSVQRFTAQIRDRPRPRWITRFIDAPLFWHFGGTVLALVLSPLCIAGALLVGFGPRLDARRRASVLEIGRGRGLSGWPAGCCVGNLD